MLTLDTMQNTCTFICKKFEIWGKSILKVVQAFHTLRIVPGSSTATNWFYWKLDDWYNAIDCSNFVYSYKMVCISAKNKHKYAKLSIPILIRIFHYVMSLLISMWKHFGTINSNWFARNRLVGAYLASYTRFFLYKNVYILSYQSRSIVCLSVRLCVCPSVTFLVNVSS